MAYSRRQEMIDILDQFINAAHPQYCLGYFFQTIIELSTKLNSSEYDSLVKGLTESVTEAVARKEAEHA